MLWCKQTFFCLYNRSSHPVFCVWLTPRHSAPALMTPSSKRFSLLLAPTFDPGLSCGWPWLKRHWSVIELLKCIILPPHTSPVISVNVVERRFKRTKTGKVKVINYSSQEHFHKRCIVLKCFPFCFQFSLPNSFVLSILFAWSVLQSEIHGEGATPQWAARGNKNS